MINILKTYAKAVVLALGLCICAVSCDKYDDTEIWNAVNDLKDKVEALENLITVVQDSDGNYYWAVYKNGKAELLLVDGAKVSVAVLPALKVSEDNEWLISVDGGKTWVHTGIYQEEQKVETEMFFKDVKVEDGYLVLTLADGTVVKVPVAGGDKEFSADVDSLWFSRGAMTKSASIRMTNVKSYTITEKPEGWKAYIEDSYIYVTSPDDFSSAPKNGTVKALALFEGGAQPEIMSVYVGYEPAFSLSLENDSVVVEMSGHTGEDFTGYHLAAWLGSEFTPELALQWLNGEGGQNIPYSGNASYSISDLAENYSPKEDYVVFIAPYLPASGNNTYVLSDIQSVLVVGGNQWSFSDIRYDNAHLKVLVSDMTQYFGGINRLEDWENYAMQNLLESFQFRGGPAVCTSLEYDGPASGFPFNETSPDLLPSTEYVVWMLPFSERGNYAEGDFITRTFTTSGISKDSSIPAPMATVDAVTISGFTATVTPVSGAYKTYAAIRPVSVLPEDEEESVTDLIRIGNYIRGDESGVVSTRDYDSDTELALVAVSVMEDGRYGEIFTQKVELNELVFTDRMSVSVTDIQHGLGDATLTLEFTGDPAYITYYASTYSLHSDENIQKFMALNQLDGLRKVEVSSLKDGKLNIDRLDVGSVYTFYAVVSDVNETYSYLYKYEFTPKISVDYVLSDSPDYEYGMPVMSGRWNGKEVYLLNVTKPAECVRFWMFKGDAEYFAGDPWSDSDKLVSRAFDEVEVHTESIRNKRYTAMYKEARVYIVWLDDKGRYHAIYEFNPNQ